jgi:hypothetical protein
LTAGRCLLRVGLLEATAGSRLRQVRLLIEYHWISSAIGLRVLFETLHTGPTTQFGRDLVLVNWQFVQWPAILGKP